MSASDSLETSILSLLFNNSNAANIGDATGLRGSSVAGNLYLSLHTADPGETGTQTTSEISYTGYARVAVTRDSSGFTVSGNAVTLTSTMSFGAMTAGTGGTATFFGVGTASSGTGVLLFSGAISPTIAVANGVTPRLTTGTTITAD